MSEELKPCPFCGGKAARAHVTGKLLGDNKTVCTHHFVNCIACGSNNAGITQGFISPEKAQAHWNTRIEHEKTEDKEQGE